MTVCDTREAENNSAVGNGELKIGKSQRTQDSDSQEDRWANIPGLLNRQINFGNVQQAHRAIKGRTLNATTSEDDSGR